MKKDIIKDRRTKQRRQSQNIIKGTERRVNKKRKDGDRRTQNLPPEYLLRKKKTKKRSFSLYFIIFFVCVVIALIYTIISNKVKETLLPVGQKVIQYALEDGR